MNPSPELNSILKQLRLSGILDSLEQRNRQAIDGQLAYTEFLAMLLHDEVARHEHKKLGTRLLRAGFAMGKTLETFDFDRLPTLNRSHVHDLATGRYLDEKVAILIAGPTGTGKSHLAQALGHCAARQGRDVLFISQTELLKRLNAARATGAYDRKFQQYARVPLLIVDDFALKPLRTPQDEDFHDLVAARYEHAATILTSNLDFGEWGAAFPDNRILGTATLDRLRHGAYRLVLEGDSYRTPKPMHDLPQNAVAKNGKKPQPRNRSNPRFTPGSAGAVTPPIPGSFTPPRDTRQGFAVFVSTGCLEPVVKLFATVAAAPPYVSSPGHHGFPARSTR